MVQLGVCFERYAKTSSMGALGHKACNGCGAFFAILVCAKIQWKNESSRGKREGLMKARSWETGAEAVGVGGGVEEIATDVFHRVSFLVSYLLVP